MIVDPAERSARELYLLMIGTIVPRPIAWVTTRSRAGSTSRNRRSVRDRKVPMDLTTTSRRDDQTCDGPKPRNRRRTPWC